MALADLATQTCSIQYKTATADGYGARTIAWTTRASGVKCLFYSSSGEVFRGPAGEEQVATAKVIMENNTVNGGDRLVVGSSYFEVLGPSNPINVKDGTQIGDHVEVFVREAKA